MILVGNNIEAQLFQSAEILGRKYQEKVMSLVPIVVEQTNRGERSTTSSMLLKERIIMLRMGQQRNRKPGSGSVAVS